MPFFSKARLEGRALEHAVAKQGGFGIRMKTEGDGDAAKSGHGLICPKRGPWRERDE